MAERTREGEDRKQGEETKRVRQGTETQYINPWLSGHKSDKMIVKLAPKKKNWGAFIANNLNSADGAIFF